LSNATASQPRNRLSSWRVAIIDDVFAGPMLASVRDSLVTFCAEVGSIDDVSEMLAGLTSCDFVDSNKVTDAAIDNLYKQRTNLVTIADQLDALFLKYDQRLGEVETIETFLKKYVCPPTRFHSIKDVFDGEPFELVFLDLLLAKGSEDEAQEIAKQIFAKFKAFILLMSNSPGANNPAQVEGFRRKTKLLQGFFDFRAKEDLCNELQFRTHIETLPKNPKVSQAVHEFVIAIEKALGGDIAEPQNDESSGRPSLAGDSSSILPGFMHTLRKLGLHDYALLCELTLLGEGHPLGDYLVRILGSHFLSRLMETSDLRNAINSLDKLRFTEFLPFKGSTSPSFHRMYADATMEDVTIPWGSHPWELADTEQVHDAAGTEDNADPDAEEAREETPVVSDVPNQSEDAAIASEILTFLGISDDTRTLPFVQFGDLFIKDESSLIYAVLSASCELQYVPTHVHGERERYRDETILLVPGKLRKIESKPAKRSLSTAGIIKWNNCWFCIDWFYGKTLSLPHCSLRILLQDRDYSHSIRLQVSRALELQQAVLSKLSRIGVEVRPPFPGDVNLTLYGRLADNSFKKLGDVINHGGLLFHGRKQDERVLVFRQSTFYDCETRIIAHIDSILALDGTPAKVKAAFALAAEAFTGKSIGMTRPIEISTPFDVKSMSLFTPLGKSETIKQIAFRFGKFQDPPITNNKEIMFCFSAEEQ
jgi:hypothetical protein